MLEHEGFRFNGQLVLDWLRAEGRKQTYLLAKLQIGTTQLNKMLHKGLVPRNQAIIKDLAALIGVKPKDLIISVKERKSA